MKQGDEYTRLEDELYHSPHAWRDYARCLDPTSEEEDILFPWGKQPPSREETAEYIESHCYECPVRQQCLDLAVSTESVGVFGGFSLSSSDVAKLQRLRKSGKRVTVEQAEKELRRGGSGV